MNKKYKLYVYWRNIKEMGCFIDFNTYTPKDIDEKVEELFGVKFFDTSKCDCIITNEEKFSIFLLTHSDHIIEFTPHE